MADIYLGEIRSNLPRLLALVDRDPTSATYGMGDRFYWAWGLIDFGNGTFQGMANGLARLWVHGHWPYGTPESRFIERIDSLYQGAAKLTRRDGSLEESFPYEGSFCVTALVAFDLLVSLDLLRDRVDEAKRKCWEAVIRPMINYLLRAEETHAIISNHLATAVAALVRWHQLTGDVSAEDRGRSLLDRILRTQSKEGWFREYQGADPGYQSLCTCYLADVHRLRPDWQLLEPLRRSVKFMWHFAHPDGSFGGLYGSRCTRFYYPAGVTALAGEIPEAAVLSDFMAKSIAGQRVVTLSSIDEPNLIPTFNAYCWAATLASKPHGVNEERQPILPSLCPNSFRHYYHHAGLLIDRGEEHYTIVATGRGGVLYHFQSDGSPIIDAGVIVQNAKGELGSSQGPGHVELSESDGTVTLTTRIFPMPKQSPGPWQFLMLRLLSVTLFRSNNLRELAKRALVRLLIHDRAPWPLTNRRKIRLGRDVLLEDETELKLGYKTLRMTNAFVPIHMSSQGYWQRQDEES